MSATIDRKTHLVMPEGHMDDLYKSSNPLVRWVHIKRLVNTSSLVPRNATKILDVGCGEGQLISFLNRVPGRDLHGVDIFDHVILQAKQRARYAKFKVADCSRIPYPSNTFDAVTCIDVLEHIPNWRDVVAEIMRVTKPGGAIILGWPNDDNWNLARLLLGKGPVPDHINILTPRIMRQAVNRKPVNYSRIPFGLPWRLCLTAQECYIK